MNIKIEETSIVDEQNAICEALIESLTNKPHIWTFNQYTADKGNISIWISNGESYCDLYKPTKINFSADYRKRLWHAVQVASLKSIKSSIDGKPIIVKTEIKANKINAETKTKIKVIYFSLYGKIIRFCKNIYKKFVNYLNS